MFNLKVVLLLLALANCSLVMNCMDPEGTENQVFDQVVLADEAAGKINWGPVWDDQEGNNEFVTRNLEENSKEGKIIMLSAQKGTCFSKTLFYFLRIN